MSHETAPTRDIPLHRYLREHAQSRPNHSAIEFYGASISYRDLDQQSDALAHQLRARGIAQGDTVALYLQNSPQFVIAFFAIQKLGAVVGPCNPMFKQWELEYQLNDLEARVIITSDDQVDTVLAVREQTQLRHVISSGYEEFLPAEGAPDFPGVTGLAPEPGTERMSELIKAPFPELAEPDIDLLTDPALVIYTSGTTGQPKGAQLSFGNAEFKTACMVGLYSFTGDDVFGSAMPVFHIAGMLVGMTSPIMAGATIVLFHRFDAGYVLRSMREQRISVFYSTPPMVNQLMAHPLFTPDSFPALRLNHGTSFGSQIDQELSDRWAAVAGTPLFEFAYGMSETHTGDALMPPGAIRYGSHGKPAFQTRLKICSVDDRSVEMPVGELGEIAVNSPSVFLGYRGRDAETAQVKVDGWYYSGDMGRIDEDGYLHFEGRTKEMIKSNGYSVFPEEVERMLIRHPAVKQAAVVGYADEQRGESARAFIVLAEGAEGTLTEEELIAWAREHMAAYKYPRSVRFIDEIPQTSTGKMLRAKLTEQG
ncbi:long-chain-fatty-acid--CoA ligase [Leucobacter sp. BZR 635]